MLHGCVCDLADEGVESEAHHGGKTDAFGAGAGVEYFSLGAGQVRL
jgi:hypothetical protein